MAMICGKNEDFLPERPFLQRLNIFYFYNRSPSYFWKWEAFLSDYRVFEAARKFYVEDCKEKAEQIGNGDDKYHKFLDFIKVPYNKCTLKKAINTRNDLVHMNINNITSIEGFTGFGTKSKENKSDDIDDYVVADYFRRMLHAVLGRLIGLKGGYFNNSWEGIGRMFFDVE